MRKLKKKYPLYSIIYNYIQWVYRTRKDRKGFPRYKVLSLEKTIQEIVTHKKSISRYGDGEFRLMLPGIIYIFKKIAISYESDLEKYSLQILKTI